MRIPLLGFVSVRSHISSQTITLRLPLVIPFCGGFHVQVAIKTMLKKYLFSEAEKASVEREIEIQKVRTYVRIHTYVLSGTSPADPRRILL